MLKIYIDKLLKNNDLTAEEMQSAMNKILLHPDETQIAAFLTLLKIKGESYHEIYGIVKKMQSLMIAQETQQPTLDIVGTGGDGSNTINISTASALLAATCGVMIAKHGNRSVSSLSGSADVLEALGVNINLAPHSIKQCLQKTNFSFLYAPNFHPAFSKIKSIRKKLGFPTIFNIIGPMLNPSHSQFLMIGVADPKYLPVISKVVNTLEINRALIFHGSGLDEISTIGPIKMIEINHGKEIESIFDPIDYGFQRCKLHDLKGGTANHNAKIIISSLKGNMSPVSDTIILNAGIANYIYGLCDSKESGILLAKETHKTGEAYMTLQKIIQTTNAHATQNLMEKNHG